jgi:ABC-type amino acid transport system permease subunit
LPDVLFYVTAHASLWRKKVAFMENKGSFSQLKKLLIGEARDIEDQRLFHKISLVALLAWVDRVLHNYAVFSLQRRLYQSGYPFLVRQSGCETS